MGAVWRIKAVSKSFVVLALTLGLAGCEGAMHDMYDQSRYDPLEPSELFPDGQSSRPLPPNTIIRSKGSIAGSSSGRLGAHALPREAGPVYPIGPEGKPHALLEEQEHGHAGRPARNPLPITRELLQRGRARFNIYCAPCHSPAGDGDGMVARRGFPHPPSYHTGRLRKAPDSHFFAVITHGYGAMYSYADRVNEHDRWAIVAYIRALQLSQHARLEDLPRDLRGKF